MLSKWRQWENKKISFLPNGLKEIFERNICEIKIKLLWLKTPKKGSPFRVTLQRKLYICDTAARICILSSSDQFKSVLRVLTLRNCSVEGEYKIEHSVVKSIWEKLQTNPSLPSWKFMVPASSVKIFENLYSRETVNQVNCFSAVQVLKNLYSRETVHLVNSGFPKCFDHGNLLLPKSHHCHGDLFGTCLLLI